MSRLDHFLKDGESVTGNVWALIPFGGDVGRVAVFHLDEHNGWITAQGGAPIRLMREAVLERSGEQRWEATRVGDRIEVTVQRLNDSGEWF